MSELSYDLIISASAEPASCSIKNATSPPEPNTNTYFGTARDMQGTALVPPTTFDLLLLLQLLLLILLLQPTCTDAVENLRGLVNTPGPKAILCRIAPKRKLA